MAFEADRDGGSWPGVATRPTPPTPFGLSLSKPGGAPPLPLDASQRQRAVRAGLVFGPKTTVVDERQAVHGAGAMWGAEQRRLEGGARSAHPRLTHGKCLSAAGAARVASFAVRHQDEQHKGSRPNGPTASTHAAAPARTALCCSGASSENGGGPPSFDRLSPNGGEGFDRLSPNGGEGRAAVTGRQLSAALRFRDSQK